MRSEAGRVHPPETVRGWLRDVGFSSIELLDLDGPIVSHAAMLARR